MVQELKFYEPTRPQLRLLDVVHRKRPIITLANMGRQVGKTYATFFDAITNALAKPKQKIMYVSPTYANNTRIMNELDSYMFDHRGMEKRVFKDIKFKEQFYKFHNGSFVKMQSAEQGDNLRGASQHWIYVDEAAFMARSIITEILLPMITRTKGHMVLTSTPNGRNWWYDWYNKGLETDKEYNPKRLISLRADYRDLNDPDVNEIIEIFRDTMTTDEFNREVLAQFITDDTLFNNIDNCVYNDGVTIILRPEERVFIGIDIGVSSDFTVITVMNEGGRVLEIDSFNMKSDKLSHQEFKDRLMALYYKYFDNLTACYIEANNNELLLEELEENYPNSYKLFPFMTSMKTKGQIISHLRYLFDKMEIAIPDDTNLINELYGYRATRSVVSGKLKYSNKGVDHDDYVVSLALAAWARHEEMDSGYVEIY